MRWTKKGMIFRTDQFGLVYAKSPQAVVFDDFVRVFFSTCERDGEKLISRIKFVDYDKSFDRILNVSDGYVIKDGELGCFDEHGIFPFSPFKIDNKIYAYSTGWTRRVSVSADSAIGVAVSSDEGRSFQRLGNGSVLSSSLYEPFLVADGYVTKIQDTFHMWYIFGERWLEHAEEDGEPSRVYKIAHTVSLDGVNWKQGSGKPIVPNRLGENECQALPTVIEGRIGKGYHMFFCYRQAIGFRKQRDCAYRIGYAHSMDLKTWTRQDNNVGISVSDDKEAWDYQMMCYPHVFGCDDKIYMLYNGNEFGKHGFGLARLER